MDIKLEIVDGGRRWEMFMLEGTGRLWMKEYRGAC